MSNIDWSKTERNFGIGNFKDRYGKECSIQESSIATESCIWLGRDVGEHFEGNCLPRMHLTQDMAGELAQILQHFAETGELLPCSSG